MTARSRTAGRPARSAGRIASSTPAARAVAWSAPGHGRRPVPNVQLEMSSVTTSPSGALAAGPQHRRVVEQRLRDELVGARVLGSPTKAVISALPISPAVASTVCISSPIRFASASASSAGPITVARYRDGGVGVRAGLVGVRVARRRGEHGLDRLVEGVGGQRRARRRAPPPERAGRASSRRMAGGQRRRSRSGLARRRRAADPGRGRPAPARRARGAGRGGRRRRTWPPGTAARPACRWRCRVRRRRRHHEGRIGEDRVDLGFVFDHSCRV